jgi:hypothetical protein
MTHPFRKINILFFLLGSVISGCKEEGYLTFKIENQYSSKIIVNYVNITPYGIASNYNTTVYVHTGDSRVMQKFSTSAGSINYDWHYAYSMYINYVVNAEGDTINFDPNVAHYWQYISDDSDSYYILTVDSTSF